MTIRTMTMKKNTTASNDLWMTIKGFAIPKYRRLPGGAWSGF